MFLNMSMVWTEICSHICIHCSKFKSKLFIAYNIDIYIFLRTDLGANNAHILTMQILCGNRLSSAYYITKSPNLIIYMLQVNTFCQNASKYPQIIKSFYKCITMPFGDICCTGATRGDTRDLPLPVS